MTAHGEIRILLADDHAIFRNGVANILRQEADLEIVAEADCGAQAIALCQRTRPHVCLVDLRMPGMGGLEVVSRIRTLQPHARAIILTTYESDEDIVLALRAGARAYLLKDVRPQELIDCIRAVHEGKTSVSSVVASKLAERITQVQLTVRELRVLRLLAQGKANKTIAEELEVSLGTIKAHITHLFEKLNVSSRTEAIAAGMSRGLIRGGW